MAKVAEENKEEAKTVQVSQKKKFDLLEYFKSPSFLVLIILILMMVIGGVVVYM